MTNRVAGYLRAWASAFTTPRGWCILGVAWAAVMGWSHRRDMDPDGLSYVEMAARTAGGEPGSLINGYWSPGYPAIVSVAMRIFHPAPRYEFQTVHLVNFCIFLFVLAAFSFFFRSWMHSFRSSILAETEKILTAFGFFIFLWSVCEHVGVGLNTPDLTVCAIVFLAAGMVARSCRPEWRWAEYAALGLILAAGYYVKAAMLPLGVVLIVLLTMVPPTAFSRRSGFALSGLCLVAGSLPLIVLTTRHVGHLAFSDTGTLNYAWYVDGVKPHWKSETDPRVVALHGPRRLSENPVTLEFAEPLHVTEALWYDPSYWAAGTRIWFDPRLQLSAVGVGAEFIYSMLLSMGSLVAGAAVLCFFTHRAGVRRNWRDSFWCLFWPAAALAMYALVHMEWRFLSSFLVLFWLAVYRVFIVAHHERPRVVVPVLAVVCGTLAIPWAGHFALAGGRGVADLLHPMPTEQERVADVLASAGLREGDRIAFAGEGFEMYFARLARVRVVAQIPDEDDFWRLDDTGARRLGQLLASIGVKAIVARGSPPEQAVRAWGSRWRPVERYSILPIRDPRQP